MPFLSEIHILFSFLCVCNICSKDLGNNDLFFLYLNYLSSESFIKTAQSCYKDLDLVSGGKIYSMIPVELYVNIRPKHGYRILL